MDSTRPMPSQPVDIENWEIELLQRCLSTKTMFDVELDCGDEARQILQASLTDSAVQHAVASLRALRQNFEALRGYDPSAKLQGPSYQDGLRQYGFAMEGIMSRLSSPTTDGLRSALLCCQVFVSIEQAQGNFDIMVQHIIRGLSIMHEFHMRPYLTASDQLVPAYCIDMPMLDVFVIKMFAAPCRFAEPERSKTKDEGQSYYSLQRQGARPVPPIAPDTRTELKKIATAVTAFLNAVALIKTVEEAHCFLRARSDLLDGLEMWLHRLENSTTTDKFGSTEAVQVTFLRLFYMTLKMILLATLRASSKLPTEMRILSDQLQVAAGGVTQRLRTYKIRSAHTTEEADLT